MTHTEPSTFTAFAVLLPLAGTLCNVFPSHSGVSHSRWSHSLAGLSRGHECDLSTIKRHPCVAVVPGRHEYPAPQGNTHRLSLPQCLTCGFRLEELCLWSVLKSVISSYTCSGVNNRLKSVPIHESAQMAFEVIFVLDLC